MLLVHYVPFCISDLNKRNYETVFHHKMDTLLKGILLSFYVINEFKKINLGK